MIKGTQKKIIVVKNPKSRIFDEAYFVVRSDGGKSALLNVTHDDMVSEANKIIARSLTPEDPGPEKKRENSRRTRLLWYLFGAASSGALFLLFSLLR